MWLLSLFRWIFWENWSILFAINGAKKEGRLGPLLSLNEKTVPLIYAPIFKAILWRDICHTSHPLLIPLIILNESQRKAKLRPLPHPPQPPQNLRPLPDPQVAQTPSQRLLTPTPLHHHDPQNACRTGESAQGQPARTGEAGVGGGQVRIGAEGVLRGGRWLFWGEIARKRDSGDLNRGRGADDEPARRQPPLQPRQIVADPAGNRLHQSLKRWVGQQAMTAEWF